MRIEINCPKLEKFEINCGMSAYQVKFIFIFYNLNLVFN